MLGNALRCSLIYSARSNQCLLNSRSVEMLFFLSIAHRTQCYDHEKGGGEENKGLGKMLHCKRRDAMHPQTKAPINETI
jgi:hypothetical protein